MLVIVMELYETGIPQLLNAWCKKSTLVNIHGWVAVCSCVLSVRPTFILAEAVIRYGSACKNQQRTVKSYGSTCNNQQCT